MPRLILFLCFFFATTVLAAQAQPREAFQTLRFSLGGAADVGRTMLHQYWEPGYGGDVSVATPFYAGVAEAGGSLHRYGAQAEVPRFDALLVFAGWGAALTPVRPLSLYAGIRVGNYRMMFDHDTYAGVRNESEVTLGVHTRADLRLGNGWTAYASGSFLQTYTYIRLRSVYVGAGISRTVRTPGWLRDLLY